MGIPSDAEECLGKLNSEVDKILKKEAPMIYEEIDKHLFSLACYMRRDDKKYTGIKNITHRNSDVTDEILNRVRAIKKKVKESKSDIAEDMAKYLALAKHIDRWLTTHNAKPRRLLSVSSTKCGKKAGLQEEMPVYLLNAITKEKPVHPVYGNLRY